MCQRPRKPCGTQVCYYIQEPNLPFSTPCISITNGLISIKFTNVMSSIYETLHTKFEGNHPSILRDISSWKMSHFLLICFSSYCFTNITLSQPKTLFLYIDVFQIWHTYKEICGLHVSLNIGDVYTESKGVMDDNMAEKCSKI